MKLILSAMVSGLARLCMGLDPDAPGIQEKKRNDDDDYTCLEVPMDQICRDRLRR